MKSCYSSAAKLKRGKLGTSITKVKKDISNPRVWITMFYTLKFAVFLTLLTAPAVMDAVSVRPTASQHTTPSYATITLSFHEVKMIKILYLTLFYHSLTLYNIYRSSTAKMLPCSFNLALILAPRQACLECCVRGSSLSGLLPPLDHKHA